MFDLSGKVAIVTGGAGGLGSAIARGLASQGASVAVTDLDQDAAADVAKSIDGEGGTAHGFALDVTDAEAVAAIVDRVGEQIGGIDILVASAGIGLRRPATEMTPSEWQKVIDINLTGCFFCDQAVGRAMISRGSGGSIINIGSVVGQVGIDTGNANYAASKGGMIGLTKTLAIEWAPYGVRVNVVAPTHFRTPLVARAIEEVPGVEQRFLANIPLGRLGEPTEVVGGIVYLASDESSMVTGHVLNIDGGHTAR
jgi:NAD(P)-dependent dehydrogenase (short-subunit alcohol dehydrogenase family)